LLCAGNNAAHSSGVAIAGGVAAAGGVAVSSSAALIEQDSKERQAVAAQLAARQGCMTIGFHHTVLCYHTVLCCMIADEQAHSLKCFNECAHSFTAMSSPTMAAAYCEPNCVVTVRTSVGWL